jgi:hypothetical protein
MLPESGGPGRLCATGIAAWTRPPDRALLISGSPGRWPPGTSRTAREPASENRCPPGPRCARPACDKHPFASVRQLVLIADALTSRRQSDPQGPAPGRPVPAAVYPGVGEALLGQSVEPTVVTEGYPSIKIVMRAVPPFGTDARSTSIGGQFAQMGQFCAARHAGPATAAARNHQLRRISADACGSSFMPGA